MDEYTVSGQVEASVVVEWDHPELIPTWAESVAMLRETNPAYNEAEFEDVTVHRTATVQTERVPDEQVERESVLEKLSDPENQSVKIRGVTYVDVETTILGDSRPSEDRCRLALLQNGPVSSVSFQGIHGLTVEKSE